MKKHVFRKRRSMTRGLLASLSTFALVTLLGSSSLFAQDQWEQQVQAQLADAAVELTAAGYELSQYSTEYELDENTYFDLWVELVGGVDYAFIGVCDVDCSDIDLELLDSESRSLDIDELMDDVPVIEYIATHSGRFRVKVYMASCAIEPCSWGVGVFAR